MPHNRRQQFNTINAPSLARWIVITMFIAAAGLSYVYLTVQLNHLGGRKKALEVELGALNSQTKVAEAQIAALTSRSALERRLKEGYVKMTPIAEQDLVRLNILPGIPAEDAIQPVVNERAGR